MDFDIDSAFSTSKKTTYSERFPSNEQEENSEEEEDALDELIVYKKPRQAEEEKEMKEEKDEEGPLEGSVSIINTSEVNKGEEGIDLAKYSAIPSDYASFQSDGQSSKPRFSSYAEITNMAKEYPFELDTFQKESVLHIENGESVLVAAHTSGKKQFFSVFLFFFISFL